MGTACVGCQNKHEAKGELINGNKEHNCQCQSRDENITIDGKFDQIAATSNDGKHSGGGTPVQQHRKTGKT